MTKFGVNWPEKGRYAVKPNSNQSTNHPPNWPWEEEPMGQIELFDHFLNLKPFLLWANKWLILNQIISIR